MRKRLSLLFLISEDKLSNFEHMYSILFSIFDIAVVEYNGSLISYNVAYFDIVVVEYNGSLISYNVAYFDIGVAEYNGSLISYNVAYLT